MFLLGDSIGIVALVPSAYLFTLSETDRAQSLLASRRSRTQNSRKTLVSGYPDKSALALVGTRGR